MATITRRVLKVIAVVGTVPAVGIAIGYRMRVQAAESSTSGSGRVHRASDLPIYPVGSSESGSSKDYKYPRNALEEQIGVARKAVLGFLGQYKGQYAYVKQTAETGVAHTKSGIDYIQNEQGELPRIAFIALAGMGGIVLGSRGGAFKKLTYGSIAALSAASLSYPKKTVELTQTATKQAKQTWKDIGGEEMWDKVMPKEDPKKTSETVDTPVTQSQPNENATSVSQEKTVNQHKKLAGDPGQSNPNDKDMYSTRSS